MTANGLCGVDKPSGGVTPETVVGGVTSNVYFARIGEIDGFENRHRPQAKTASRVTQELLDRYAAMSVTNIQLEGPMCFMASARADDWRNIIGVFTAVGYITGRSFIDASYEMDLAAAVMGKNGYRYGRESFAETGEPNAGVQPQGIPANYGPDQGGGVGFQQYTGTIGVPTLDEVQALPLPIIVPDPLQTTGQGDKLVQAYNFRLSLTRDPANYMPLIKPYGYDTRFYATLAQKLANDRQGRPSTHQSWKICRGGGSYGYQEFTAGKKVNWNAMDALNFSALYPEASWARRREIVEQHVLYQQGQMWFTANDPEALNYGLGYMQADWNDTTTPDNTGATGPLGLPGDEFQYSQFGAGWPEWCYVRETRRMIGKVTVTYFDQLDANLGGTPTKATSIGKWAYTWDVHAIQLTRKLNVGAGVLYTDRLREEGTPANVTDHTAAYEIPVEMILPHEQFKI
ncbi:FAD-dependent oxidoreductase, partial [Novosphingobium guangzhouense]|uniref:FAD-dependent oxidoreductase n=1 Tax=Novosphingobium guangzhouense TaxID=1850347 RepID=UPI001473AC85